MADHRRLRSKRDNYPQLKADRKNKRFISVAGVFLLLAAAAVVVVGVGINPLTRGHRSDQVTPSPGEGPHNLIAEYQGNGWVIIGLLRYVWKIIRDLPSHEVRLLPDSVAQDQGVKIQRLTLLLLWSSRRRNSVFVLGSTMAPAAFAVVCAAQRRVQVCV